MTCEESGAGGEKRRKFRSKGLLSQHHPGGDAGSRHETRPRRFVARTETTGIRAVCSEVTVGISDILRAVQLPPMVVVTGTPPIRGERFVHLDGDRSGIFSLRGNGLIPTPWPTLPGSRVGRVGHFGHPHGSNVSHDHNYLLRPAVRV